MISIYLLLDLRKNGLLHAFFPNLLYLCSAFIEWICHEK